MAKTFKTQAMYETCVARLLSLLTSSHVLWGITNVQGIAQMIQRFHPHRKSSSMNVSLVI
jgi:hypothetical protein